MDALNDHWKVIFNGNGYSADWPEEAVKRGVWRIDSNVDSIIRLKDPKNIQLFESLNIYSKEECEARAEVCVFKNVDCTCVFLFRPKFFAQKKTPFCLVHSSQVMLEHYIGTVEMEANCMIDMIHQQILPAMKESGCGDLVVVGAAVTAVKTKLEAGQHCICDSQPLQQDQGQIFA